MELIQINNKIDRLCKLVANHHLSDVFRELNQTITENKSLVILNDKIRKQAEIYTNLLKYAFMKVEDPDRDIIYSNLLRALYAIIDEIKKIFIEEKKFWAINTIRQETNFEFLANRGIIEKSILSGKLGQESDKVFKRIWTSALLNEEDIEFLEKILKSKKTNWVDESLIVSALTISLLMNFDERKLYFLFGFYYKGTPKVWQRAFVGLVFGIYFYSSRLKDYPEIVVKIKQIKTEKDFFKNLGYTILQIIRTKDTDKISRKLHEEIIPEVAKMKPKIEEKLRLDDILKEQFGEDKNPDWEMVFEDSPDLLNKLEEFSKMQIEGADVFMSAFAMLKHFDFFKKPSNWFLPFYKENKEVKEAFRFEKEGFNSELFIEGLEKSAFLCNSDKYSFIMNVRYMPDVQKNMMLEMFNAELENMNEIVKDDELVNKSMIDKYIINQYIQDLYRFFKISPDKSEFLDIFGDKLDLYNTSLFLEYWYDEEMYSKIGGLYFKNEYFIDTVNVYKILIEKGFNNQQAFEKIAFSFQKLKDFDNALKYYKKAELFGTNLNWNYKKIALCYREKNNHEKAIEYYHKAESEEPENLYIQAHLGHAYLRIKDYENALKHYFKVEYFAPSNNKILRPIAWCSFVMGKFDTSIKYYQKIIEMNDASVPDFIGLGNSYWCKHEIEKAVEFYRKGLKMTTDETIFKKDFLDDKEFLTKHGILPFEIELMLDFLFLDKMVKEFQ
ncbi:MAG: tetratricopeptide repeat protein [Bacteroidales bacterium]